MQELKPEKTEAAKAPKKKHAGWKAVPIWAWVVAGVLLLAGALLTARWCLGAAFVADYEQGTYREDIPESLRLINFPQGHVADYDMGLVKYREGDYESAADLFYNAVASELEEGQDCDARVNLALSVCNQMNLEAARAGDEEAREFALECLHFGRDVLMENGCAADDDSFHDADAQQLKEDIDKLIEELEQEQPPNGGGGDDDDDNDGQDQNDSDDKQDQKEQEDPLKEQLKEQQRQNSQQMQNFQDTQEQMDRFLNGNEEGQGGGKPW